VLIEHGSVALAYAERGVSRRRVVQGVAWSVPAVLIATAAPAAAASPAVQGGLALTSSSATMNTSNIFVTTTVAYVGDGTPSPDHPVTGVTIEVTVPTARVSGADAGVAALDWTYVGKVTSGSNTIFTFRHNGLPLESSNPVTSRVTVRLPVPNPASLAALNVSIVARGTSNGAPVLPASTTVSAVLGADLVVDNAKVTWIDWMPAPDGGNREAYRVEGQARWNGPYWPEGPAITGLQLVVRMAQSCTDGTYHVSTLGPGWSLTQAPTLANGVWEARWTFAGTIGPGDTNTTPWDILFRATGAMRPNAVTLAVSGTAAGSPHYFTWSGPTP